MVLYNTYLTNNLKSQYPIVNSKSGGTPHSHRSPKPRKPPKHPKIHRPPNKPPIQPNLPKIYNLNYAKQSQFTGCPNERKVFLCC